MAREAEREGARWAAAARVARVVVPEVTAVDAKAETAARAEQEAEATAARAARAVMAEVVAQGVGFGRAGRDSCQCPTAPRLLARR